MALEIDPQVRDRRRKTKLVSLVGHLIRCHPLDYGQFEILCRAAHKETALRRPR